MNPIIMPYIDCVDLTRQAALDCLAQTLPPSPLLLIDNGSQAEGRALADDLQRTAGAPAQILVWHHLPPFPSLGATWNRALRFCWEAGADHALVVNNDVRLAPWTYARLLEVQQKTEAWFVTAVGVTAPQFETYLAQGADSAIAALGMPTASRKDGMRPEGYSYGGPDFSCYLITKACHAAYQFDEGFIPGYCEDLDMHRRMLLGGDGHRIFGVNLPFYHIGSATINRSPEAAKRAAVQIEQGSRAYFHRKWGGGCNEERYRIPFDTTSAEDGITTPDLQHAQASPRPL